SKAPRREGRRLSRARASKRYPISRRPRRQRPIRPRIFSPIPKCRQRDGTPRAKGSATRSPHLASERSSRRRSARSSRRRRTKSAIIRRSTRRLPFLPPRSSPRRCIKSSWPSYWAPGTTVSARSTVAVAAPSAITSATAAFTARSAVAVTAAAAMTITARATVAAFTRFARRTGIGQLLAGFLVDEAHREADLTARIDLDQLDPDLLAFAQDVADILDPLVLDLADVHQPVLAGHESHERAEIDDARH